MTADLGGSARGGGQLRPQPFKLAAPDSALEDLRERLARTRWPVAIPDEGWDLGSDRRVIARLVRRWLADYDWRESERELNSLPHYRVDLDGAAVHFLHFRARGSSRLPLVLTHGWPGSFLELASLAERLSDPGAHGVDPRLAFDVVVPSLPGFAFSEQRPQATDPASTPDLWHRLMTEVLGYERYGAHGGDLGAGVSTRLAAKHSDKVVGVHLLAVAAPPSAEQTNLSDDEQAYLEQVARWEQEEGAYEHQQMTRPLTLAYGLSDSPAGLLAWLVEKLRAWSDCGGELSRRFSDDQVLTWVTLYWLTNTIASSFRPYSDFLRRPLSAGKVRVPTAVAVFPYDLTQPPREWAERSYEIVRYTRMPRGGHFAAYEEPDLLGADIAAFFTTDLA
jgi:pimeloyl-ACP methyl ester carboxylesterase